MSSHQPYRLAILECDDPLDETRRNLGGHTGCYKQLFAETVASFGDSFRSFVDDLEITSWDVIYTQKYPSLQSVDAIIVSGSRFSSYEESEWLPKLVAFVTEAIKIPDLPVVGICFGHQLIARCLGGTVARNTLGWEISGSEVSLTESGQKLFSNGKQSIVS
jgi:GMP synthase-like glutamine amidotransferase